MNGLKGYYLSKLDLKDNDVVVVTIDTDEADIEYIESYEDFFRQISDAVKPHPVVAIFKGIKISKAAKERAIELLQDWEEEDV